MRKIISKESENSKRRRNQIAIGAILIFVMIFSVLGYSLSSDEKNSNTKIIYNKIEFTKESNLWNAQIGSLQFSFKYNPNETGKINSDNINLLNNYKDKPLYIYSEDIDAESEIYRNLFYQNQIVQRMQDACPEGEKCENNFPVKNCDNNFIIIKESGSTDISQQENCVFISGKKEELAKLSDRFLFKITGIQ